MIADKNLNQQDLENSEKMEEKIKKEEKSKKRINEESIEYSRIHSNKNNNFNLEKKHKISLKEIEFNYIDPFFFQIAKQYDQGGSNGLLLNNIKKDKNLIYVLYNQKSKKNVIKDRQLSKKIPFKKVYNLTKKFKEQTKEKIISKDLAILKEKLLKVDESFKNLINREFTLDINTSMIQIKDNFYKEDNLNLLEKDLYEEINNTQIKLSENPILIEEELYDEEENDMPFLENNVNENISEENKEDNEKIFYDLEENINEFSDNFDKEESFEENLFDENFKFWDYLEPNLEKISFLKRKTKIKFKKKNYEIKKETKKKKRFG